MVPVYARVSRVRVRVRNPYPYPCTREKKSKCLEIKELTPIADVLRRQRPEQRARVKLFEIRGFKTYQGRNQVGGRELRRLRDVDGYE